MEEKLTDGFQGSVTDITVIFFALGIIKQRSRERWAGCENVALVLPFRQRKGCKLETAVRRQRGAGKNQ